MSAAFQKRNKTDLNFSEIKANVIGDSITYGAYTGPDDVCPASVAEKPWCVVAAEILSFSCIRNYGSSGTSVSRTTSVLPERAFSLRYVEMDSDADLIIAAGGTNDFGTAVVLGSYEDTADISFCGALNVFCKGLKEKYPKSAIVFITPINRSDETYNANGNSLQEYRRAIREIAGQKFGFNVIDGENLGIAGNTELFLSDGCHPTPKAHEMLGNNIAIQLAVILSNRKITND